MQPRLILLGILLGAASHLGIFIRGEWHLRAPTVALIHIAAIALGPALWVRKENLDFVFCYVVGAQLFASYVAGLFSSIIIYRLFFHRLRHFPGPFLAATTKLWHVYQNRASRNHLVLDKLYKQHGPFVRTGMITSFSFSMKKN